MPRRSLMLAGGGLKIAFQAGVLQVLLDEAGVQFDHGDAVSAACFNLAMWAQGMMGESIADAWRNLDPVSVLDAKLSLDAKLLERPGLLDLDKFRTKVFPAWGIDFERIRQHGRDATFNVYNFTRHELQPIPSSELTEDYLIACASLPVWFPPATIGGETCIDAIFHLPCNFEEAIRRGADELWVIWTVSQSGEWHDGLINNFFDLFEATTNFAYKQMLRRVERNNAAVERGEASEYGRSIVVRELKAEVPVHYLLNFSRDRAGEAVNRGVEYARAWCSDNGFALGPTSAGTTSPARAGASFRFRESASGELDGGARLRLELQVEIDDLDRFLTDPHHWARVTGNVDSSAIGGTVAVQDGAYNLLIDAAQPGRKTAAYHLTLTDGTVVTGGKDLHDEGGRGALTDPSTTFLELTRGGSTLARGIARSGPLDFLEHLASFRSGEPTLSGKAAAVKRFGAFYLGRLWDVYARDRLPVAPF